jgi:8-oxo-dGTP pyrophosphatase MutT (NUDIX family)
MTTGLVDLPARFGLERSALDRLRQRPGGTLRAAASVVLVRDGVGGLEVFLLERAAEMAFAAGMSVFPGGGVDAGDREAGVVDPELGERTAEAWGLDAADAAAVLACAVRETYEETGVLLATPLDGGAQRRLGDDARERLAARDVGLGALLRDAGLVARPDLLAPWARWITPEIMPRRYDTCFFVAAVPPGQDPDGRTSEAIGAGWCAPADALRQWDEGLRGLMPPTWAVLGELAHHGDAGVDALLALAGDRRPRAVTPSFSDGDDRVGLAVPAHALDGGR